MVENAQWKRLPVCRVSNQKGNSWGKKINKKKIIVMIGKVFTCRDINFSSFLRKVYAL